LQLDTQFLHNLDTKIYVRIVYQVGTNKRIILDARPNKSQDLLVAV